MVSGRYWEPRDPPGPRRRLLLLLVAMAATTVTLGEIPAQLDISPDSLLVAGSSANVSCSADAEGLWALQLGVERPGRVVRWLWVPEANAFLESSGREPHRVAGTAVRRAGLEVRRWNLSDAAGLWLRLRADHDTNGTRFVCVALAYRRYARQPEEEWRSEKNLTLTVVREAFNMTLQAAAGGRVLQQYDSRVRLPDGSIRVEVRCRMWTEVPDSQLELRSGGRHVDNQTCSPGRPCLLSVNVSADCGTKVTEVQCTASSDSAGGQKDARVLRLSRVRVPKPQMSFTPKNRSGLVFGDSVTCSTAGSPCADVSLRVVRAPKYASTGGWQPSSGVGKASLSVSGSARGGDYEVECRASDGAGEASERRSITVKVRFDIRSQKQCVKAQTQQQVISCAANVPVSLRFPTDESKDCYAHGNMTDFVLIARRNPGSCTVACVNDVTGAALGQKSFEFKELDYDDEGTNSCDKINVTALRQRGVTLPPPTTPPPAFGWPNWDMEP